MTIKHWIQSAFEALFSTSTCAHCLSAEAIREKANTGLLNGLSRNGLSLFSAEKTCLSEIVRSLPLHLNSTWMLFACMLVANFNLHQRDTP